MKTNQDRVYSEGIYWLANNTDNAGIGDAIRLLAYLTDTDEEWIFQEVGIRQDEMAAVQRKSQEAA